MRWLQRRHDPGRPWYRRYGRERCNRAVAPQGIRLRKAFAPFRGELATTPLQVKHQQNAHRANALRALLRAHALNHGGAMD
jgi:hypothetical protein